MAHQNCFRFHVTPVRMTKNFLKDNTRMWGKNIYSVLVGLQTAAATVKICVTVPRKAGKSSAVRSSDSPIGLYPLRYLSVWVSWGLLSVIGLSACATGGPVQKGFYIWLQRCLLIVLITALFTMARKWRQPSCLSTDECLKKMYSITQWTITKL